jgi:hypothetical protein
MSCIIASHRIIMIICRAGRVGVRPWGAVAIWEGVLSGVVWKENIEFVRETRRASAANLFDGLMIC